MRKVFFSLLMLSLALSSCTLYKDVEVVHVGEIRVTEMGQDGVKAEIDLTLSNPNSFNVKLVDSDIDVWVNNAPIGKVRLAENLLINKKSNEPLVLKLMSSYDDLSPDFLATALSLIFARNAQFKAEGYIKGKALLIGKKVDVQVDQEVKLK
jgi:LEA14-like dessication related protein